MKAGILSEPNCTPLFVDEKDLPEGPEIMMGRVLDGVANHMLTSPEDEGFRVADKPTTNVVDILKEKEVDILINYLPVGSQKATEFYAECCIESKVSLLNCIPVFIASDETWEKKFVDAGIPLIGDDMKSQFGASIFSQMIQELAFSRGHHVKCHIQRNVGGNTDFLNMTDKNRVVSKKKSKENVIRSQNIIRDIPMDNSYYHAGPSEYIRHYKDNKIANFHVELEGFMGSPVTLDAQLSVIDSPNSAGVVMDAIRYLKVAREMGIKGSLRGPSAFTQKSPPQNLTYTQMIEECDALSDRQLTRITEKQVCRI
jgi:myo-inositol-1-phosphate synthase